MNVIQQQNYFLFQYNLGHSSLSIKKNQSKQTNNNKMQKLSSFFYKTKDILSQNTTISFQELKKQLYAERNQENNQEIGCSELDDIKKIDQNLQADILPLTVQNILLNERPFENLKLQESKIIPLQSKLTTSMTQGKKSRSIKINTKPFINESRIRQIEQEKRRILSELEKLDSQIIEIKKQQNETSDHQSIQKMQRSNFHKKAQIADDVEAKRQAQSLIKQLHLQKKKIQEKKRKIQEMQLQKRKREEEQKRRQREQIQKKLKEQKRLLIEKRLEQDRRKRQQRKLVQKQSNLLIMELKKQQELEKQQKLIPGQILDYEQKKKLLEKKNIFNYQQIHEHQKKYQQLKSIQKQRKRQRSQSIKLSKPNIPKYQKNIWVQKLEEEEQRKKEQEKMKQLAKKIQLEKRMQYGATVKSMFLSKYKKRQQSIQKMKPNQHSKIEEEKNQETIEVDRREQVKKPQTPNPQSHLPTIQKRELRQNKTDKKFKSRQNQEKRLIVQSKVRSRLVSKSKDYQKQPQKERDPEQQERIRKQKQRQLQIRRQTKERLKKLQNKSIQIPKPQKVKYENYIAKVKVKKQHPHEEWKRIMSNQKLSKEQKYKEMLSKAAHMQNQAKLKQDLRKSGDQDAVNLYIGSIQAKLALLEKF